MHSTTYPISRFENVGNLNILTEKNMDPRNHSFLQIFLNTEYRLFASEPWQTVIANILNALSIYHICMSRAQLLLCGFFFNGLIHFLRDFCFLVFSF